MTSQEFKAEIKRRTDKDGVTTTASAFSVSRQTVYNWLNGKLPPAHMLRIIDTKKTAA